MVMLEFLWEMICCSFNRQLHKLFLFNAILFILHKEKWIVDDCLPSYPLQVLCQIWSKLEKLGLRLNFLIISPAFALMMIPLDKRNLFLHISNEKGLLLFNEILLKLLRHIERRLLLNDRSQVLVRCQKGPWVVRVLPLNVFVQNPGELPHDANRLAIAAAVYFKGFSVMLGQPWHRRFTSAAHLREWILN